MKLYNDHLTKQEIEILARMYQVQTKLGNINKFQSKIHPLMKSGPQTNDHAASWREIEAAKGLIEAIINDFNDLTLER